VTRAPLVYDLFVRESSAELRARIERKFGPDDRDPGDAYTTELPPNGNYSAPGVSACRVGGRAPGSVGNKWTPATR